MQQFERRSPRTMGRRGFLKATGGVAVFFGAFTLIGCGDGDRPAATPAPSPAGPGAPRLYERLGGNAAITAVVAQFIQNVGADRRINGFFATTDLGRLQVLLVEQIGEATGGPEKYTGRDMKTAHAGLGITVADFNALVEDLVMALDQFKVPEREKNELLGLLGPMQADIVTA